ncbi:peptidase S16 [Martelella alba]|uniref:Peptidase S16 n=1 Tax=Martelella alba TaxID=2590451 RepID=A0A506UEM6_9HYPH|nr:LON peptidase substrate-binding domain-containing protein [Martelella alba]TPW32450.1 peptidase S16 [Martelella alba]
MQVGNARYIRRDDLPEAVPVFPLPGALLLPQGHLPLNIFEPRYLALFDRALSGNRLVGLVQPARVEEGMDITDVTPLAGVGCIGRVTSFAETGDGRYLTALTGVCRFRLMSELRSTNPYRSFEINPFMGDLKSEEEEDSVNRTRLLEAFRAYLDAEGLEVDWSHIEQASNLVLVNSLAMMAPFGAAEKQALLEAEDLKTRAELFVAITEFALAGDPGEKLQ